MNEFEAVLFGYSYSGKIRITMTGVSAFPHNRASTLSTHHSLGHYEEVVKPLGMRLTTQAPLTKGRESKSARGKTVPFSSIRDHFLRKSGNIYTLSKLA